MIFRCRSRTGRHRFAIGIGKAWVATTDTSRCRVATDLKVLQSSLTDWHPVGTTAANIRHARDHRIPIQLRSIGEVTDYRLKAVQSHGVLLEFVLSARMHWQY